MSASANVSNACPTPSVFEGVSCLVSNATSATWGDATANTIGPLFSLAVGLFLGATLLGVLAWLYASPTSPEAVRRFLRRFARVLKLSLFGAAALSPFAIIAGVAYMVRNVSAGDARMALFYVAAAVAGLTLLAIVGRVAEAWLARVRGRWASPPADDAERGPAQ